MPRYKWLTWLCQLALQNLDFDFEKCCSISLSPVNVYACLVCGKYFQARQPLQLLTTFPALERLLHHAGNCCCSVRKSNGANAAPDSAPSPWQGRGQVTHAFTHALETGHHMFMKLGDGRVYCLPEGYEVDDRSLDAIRYVLNPTFTPDRVPPPHPSHVYANHPVFRSESTPPGSRSGCQGVNMVLVGAAQAALL